MTPRGGSVLKAAGLENSCPFPSGLARYGPPHVGHDPSSAPGGSRIGGFTGGIAALAEGELYALQHQFALDGRVSPYPASARGFSVANSYLLNAARSRAADRHGFGKDEPAIRGEIEALIAPGTALSLFPLRLNEFMSINNVATFAGHFNVDQCYTSNPTRRCGRFRHRGGAATS